MKPGDFKKFYVEYYGGKTEECIGIVLELRCNEIIFLDAVSGNIRKFNRCVITKDTSTRGISPEARKLMNNYFKIYEKKRKEEIRHQKEIQKLDQEMEVFTPAAIVNAMGLCTPLQFKEAFLDALPSRTKEQMEEYGYNIEIWGEQISIERTDFIEKYFRKGSFVYEEYDGTIQMCTDCKKDKIYQAYLRKYSKPLNVKASHHSWLSIGDKDWLICTDEYRIDIRKPLTMEYAKELAKKL